MKRNTKECANCNRQISLSNITKHEQICKGVIHNPSPALRYDWEMIQHDYTNGMSYRDLQGKYGMSQNTIAKARQRGDLITRSRTESAKLFFEKNGPNVMGDQAKLRQSQRMSEANPGGRCKWFEVAGKKVQGTWERDIAMELERRNVKWERCKPIPYIIDDIDKHYTPDFYLPEYNVYLEVKGYWWGNDKEKMDAVVKQHTDKRFVIVEKTEYRRILGGEQVW